ncbi:MAG TPA: 2-hydroxyglutaryl-CoA dehydratase [Oscillospiraceae bacterium]|nr:2-hydroxyglutaryl-CoA dehydratase [Oscillospiraceae bacterium]
MAKINNKGNIEFTKKMKKQGYTILVPMMAPIHFKIIEKAFQDSGYNLALLHNSGRSVVEEGLKYVHNDMCYPALLAIGQLIDALNSGEFDVNRSAVMITQTGGGCRASNYIHLLRKALKKAGYSQVPVISLNMSGLEKNEGFKLTLTLIIKFLAGVVYGDMLMLLNNQIRSYEINKGESEALIDTWVDEIVSQLHSGRGWRMKDMKKNLDEIVKDFSKIPVNKVPKVKVGVVGEIYVKYSSLGNNNLEDFLISEDCEICVPGLMGFGLFKVDNRLEDIKLYGGKRLKKFVVTILMNYLLKLEDVTIKAVEKYPQFTPPARYAHIKELVKGFIGYGNKMGEGWLLTAEMVELIDSGFENVVCTQPFGCLPNHICGKGMIGKIRESYEQSNIVPIDYDPSASAVNQENRIKLMLAVAKERLAENN